MKKLKLFYPATLLLLALPAVIGYSHGSVTPGSAPAKGKLTFDIKKCKDIEVFEGDGTFCVVVGVKNLSSSASATNVQVKVEWETGPSSNDDLGGQGGKSYTCKVKSVKVHETMLLGGGSVSLTVSI